MNGIVVRMRSRPGPGPNMLFGTAGSFPKSSGISDEVRTGSYQLETSTKGGMRRQGRKMRVQFDVRGREFSDAPQSMWKMQNAKLARRYRGE